MHTDLSDDVRRSADGSVDVAFYLVKARIERSRACREFVMAMAKQGEPTAQAAAVGRPVRRSRQSIKDTGRDVVQLAALFVRFLLRKRQPRPSLWRQERSAPSPAGR